MIGMSKQIIKKVKLPGGLLISLMIVLLLASFVTGCTKANTAAQPQTSSSQVSTSGNIVIPLFDETTTTSLYERLIPGIVEIDTFLSTTAGSLSNTPPDQGGSGFFIDDKGHILTNNHVVENGKSVIVILHNGDIVDATIVGTDPQSDLAIISVDPSKAGQITVMTLGDSDSVKPGQMAIAMGSPDGLQGSITVGVISGLGRSVSVTNASRTLPNMIQTDAAINFGNSGGPLLNSRGEVIGINTATTALSAGTGSAIPINGEGFAIPINTAKAKLTALLAGGQLKAAYLGITGMAIDQTLATKIGLPVNKGVYVISATKDGPADKAGLKGSGQDTTGMPSKGGDIITAVDGVSVAKVEDMLSYFDTKKPGDAVSLSINRDGRQITVKVTLGEWPANLTNPS